MTYKSNQLAGKQTRLTLYSKPLAKTLEFFPLPVKTDGSFDLSRVCSKVKDMEEGGTHTCLGCGHS